MITLRSVFKKFGNQTVFENLSLDIPIGKLTVIAGPSGSGKTTLLRMIAGLDIDYTGNISGAPEKIAYAFQEDRLLPWKTVRGNLGFVLKDVMSTDEADKTINEIIGSVQLSGHEDKLPSGLSGGMKSRVSLARALCFPNDLLILDEPFAGLDEKLKGEMTELFDRLYVSAGKTAIMVTHDLNMARALKCNIIDIGNIKQFSPV